ncbi:MAG TPA: TIGR04086 family membrane protein [Nocardioides sp.]|nr:TIGR04086 family membrane protein [Nocardioides sp.]
MSDLSRDGATPVGHDDARHTIPKPADEEVVYRVDDTTEVVGAGRRGFDVPATIAGALAALGTLLVLSSLLSALGGTIGFQTGVDEEDLAIGSVVGALVALFVSCLVGGWVAGRIARHREALHGLVAPLWLLLLAAVLAGLATLLGDELDVSEQVGLPNWFSRDTLEVGAIVTGLLALALMLLGGWLGGRLAARHRDHTSVAVVETKRAVRERPGGIVRGRSNR